jgi:hypothetical protein
MNGSAISTPAVERLPEPKPPRLLDQLSQAARQRSSEPTTAQLGDGARRFILLHNKRHSADCRIMPIAPRAPWFSCAFGFSCRVGEAA